MVLGMKNFLILGFTHRTGFNTAKFLSENGCNVYISDKVRDEEKERLIQELRVSAKGEVHNLLGSEDVKLDDIEIIISSPGVPLTNPIIQKANKMGIEVIGDIELFYRLKPNIRYVAITGTDGKTTTTNITYRVLSAYHKNTFIGGNVGIPIFSLYDENIQTLVLEISSFQIDTTKHFRPQVGAITNIAKDHLDRYASFEDYINSKFSLFKNSTSSDVSIVNKSLTKYGQYNTLKTMKVLFSAYVGREGRSEREVYLEGSYICIDGKRLIDTSRIKLIGRHNVENIMVSVAIGVELGVPVEVMEEVIYSFSPLPHRMEFVREIDDVRYINDSKSTTINSMVSAVRSLDNPIILIVGGLDKGMDFGDAVDVIKEKVKFVIAIGSTKDVIEEKLKKSGYQNIYKSQTLEEAVYKAREVAKRGDVVLFSPAYASFDMFKNYEDRGDKFKGIVNSIT
ncbi:MAG: UDP-N-acetylmuramoyl-L-alanine--D-glutamate ligase [Spirochaetia bacterium]|nr:UDP-N-acetylmuramoyl-L-alanine--D-glutamate ligase [Spirochaetota bacterium]MCX8096507.1 UDP-N-acetylmuramoyl-L-alanine--D-glutamate ligase [Spirochaetota bacterium]MDW8112371.1 UDP-N-acetylmuramoyl-L-alanine--D-glutamate ligase [Spirochaetia bacterium]